MTVGGCGASTGFLKIFGSGIVLETDTNGRPKRHFLWRQGAGFARQTLPNMRIHETENIYKGLIFSTNPFEIVLWDKKNLPIAFFYSTECSIPQKDWIEIDDFLLIPFVIYTKHIKLNELEPITVLPFVLKQVLVEKSGSIW